MLMLSMLLILFCYSDYGRRWIVVLIMLVVVTILKTLQIVCFYHVCLFPLHACCGRSLSRTPGRAVRCSGHSRDITLEQSREHCSCFHFVQVVFVHLRVATVSTRIDPYTISYRF